MGCIQAYFKKAQSGLSPSSTLEQEPAEIITEENVSGRASEKISCSAVTEDEEGTEDDDPDKSQGVRATAVLTLAASTGTVAILGTTAQPLPTDLSDTTLNTVQNLEIEDSHINHLDHTHERHIPLKDSIDLDDKHQEVENLIEYTQEPKRIFSEKAISDSNNISNGGINQKTIPPQTETTSVTDVTPDSPDVTISAPEAKDTPDVTISEVKGSASDVTISEAKDSVTDVTISEAKEVTITPEVKDAPVCSRVPELTVTSDSSDNVAVDESDVTDTEPRSESEAANLLEHEVSEETSSPLVVQQLELEEKSSSPSTADSDVTMQKESKTEKDVSDTSISIDEKTETHTNEYNLIENEDSSESVTHSLGTKLNFSEVLNPEKEVTEAVNQRLSSLVRGISEDEMPTTVLELTKDYVNGVDVWREDNNLTKDLGNEYIERVKLKAEDLVNEICAKAETVNQNGLAKDIVTSVNFAKANSVDSYRPPLAETKLKTSMTSSFEDALLNVNFGEGAEAPTFCPRLSTIGSELELKVAEELSPVDKSGSSFSDGDLSPDPKGLSDSVIETIKGEIAEICEEAADRAAQLLAEKAAEEAESDSNEISENGTSTNNPSISFSDDTQIIESSIHAPVDEKLASAATTIQASFRGYQVRKAHKKQENPRTESTVVDEDELPPPDMELLGSEGDTISEEDLPQPPEFDDLPLPEDLAELDEYVVTPEIRDQMVRRNTIIAETRLSGLSAASMNESSSEIDSSLSSAATKIQAGIRGYLTRKHLKNTSSTTAPSMDDSDLSTGEPNQIKKALSVEETEIQRHPFSPDEKYMVGKRMSLDSRINPSSGSRGRAPMRSTMSECADDRDQWFVGSEAEEKAAARIQSGYRGYKTRQRLKRGDAVQQPTTSSSVTPASASPATAASPRTHSAASDEPPTPKHTGEYHDVLALSPPVLHSVVEEDADGDESSESEPKKGASEAELVDAAIKIQSVFRGYKTRKELNEGDSRTETESLDSTQTEPTTEPKKTSEPAPAEGEEDPDVNEANATKIQAHIRGYLTRKQLEEKREAAVKIQDNFRKYNARKKAKNQN